MDKFLEFIEDQCKNHGWNFGLYYSSIMDWCITVGHKATSPKANEPAIINVHSCDLQLVFAKAEVEIKKWLSENEDGY